MFITQSGNSLDLYDDLIEADEVRSVDLFQATPFVLKLKLLLGSKREALQS